MKGKKRDEWMEERKRGREGGREGEKINLLLLSWVYLIRLFLNLIKQRQQDL